MPILKHISLSDNLFARIQAPLMKCILSNNAQLRNEIISAYDFHVSESKNIQPKQVLKNHSLILTQYNSKQWGVHCIFWWYFSGWKWWKIRKSTQIDSNFPTRFHFWIFRRKLALPEHHFSMKPSCWLEIVLQIYNGKIVIFSEQMSEIFPFLHSVKKN